MLVYEKVRSYIDANGLKHSVIANKARISPSTFSQLLSGKRTMNLDDFKAICIALDVSPEAFITYQGTNG